MRATFSKTTAEAIAKLDGLVSPGPGGLTHEALPLVRRDIRRGAQEAGKIEWVEAPDADDPGNVVQVLIISTASGRMVRVGVNRVQAGTVISHCAQALV